jgi:hypothetical protein
LQIRTRSSVTSGRRSIVVSDGTDQLTLADCEDRDRHTGVAREKSSSRAASIAQAVDADQHARPTDAALAQQLADDDERRPSTDPLAAPHVNAELASVSVAT